MPPSPSLKNELLAALARDLGEALQMLVQKVSPASRHMRDILHQSGRYYNARRDFQQGLTPPATRDLVFNGVRDALLDLVGALTDADFKANEATNAASAVALGLAAAPTATPLHLLFTRLRVDWKNVPLSELHLVNCDRTHEFRTLKRALRDRAGGGQRFQFYFINACPMQRPQSFAERVLLEMLGNLDEDETEAMLVRRLPNHRLRVEELPFDFMGLEASKKKLARYFAERFDCRERVEPVEEFLRACVRRMKGYRYIAFIFRIDANDWEPFFPDYLQWLMDTFTSICEECPTCLFFFPVWVRNLHDTPPQALREVAGAVAALGEAKNAVSTVISPLQPVPKGEIEDWFVEFGEPDAAKVDELILLTLQREQSALGRVGRFLEKGEVDMYDVEALQAAVYEYAQG